jgi:hypothetical protein
VATALGSEFFFRREGIYLSNQQGRIYRVLDQGKAAQGSPLSPILFLLYNKKLLCIANRPNLKVHFIMFVDDLNLLA